MGECQTNVGHMVVIQLPGAKGEGSRCAQPALKLPLHHPCICSLSHWHWLSKADGSLEWRLTTGNQDRDWVRLGFHCIIFQLISSSVMKL